MKTWTAFLLLCITHLTYGQSLFRSSDALYNVSRFFLPSEFGNMGVVVWEPWTGFMDIEWMKALPSSFINDYFYDGYLNKNENVGILIWYEKPKLSKDNSYCKSQVSGQIFLPSSMNENDTPIGSVLQIDPNITLLSFDESLVSEGCNVESLDILNNFVISELVDNSIITTIFGEASNLINECKIIDSAHPNFWDESNRNIGYIGQNPNMESFYLSTTGELHGTINFIINQNSTEVLTCTGEIID